MEISNLLVPLDGSKMAEAALPWALWLARALDATVTLLHVIERRAPRTIHGEPHLREPAAAGEYLEGLAAAFPEDVRAETHVHTVAEGDLAASIARHTGELDTDLVVLSAHGRPGARGRLLGGVAQQVLRQATNPVMLLRPEAAATREPRLGSILAPLDGTPEAEAVLPVATSIARTAGAPVRLLLVVPTVGTVRGDRAATARVSPLATAALLDVEQENAVEYLESVAARLREGGVEASGAVMRGDAVDAVAEGARWPEIGLVAMASHGRSGFAALWSGSVGTGVQAWVEKPMLLLHPARAELGHDRGAETGR